MYCSLLFYTTILYCTILYYTIAGRGLLLLHARLRGPGELRRLGPEYIQLRRLGAEGAPSHDEHTSLSLSLSLSLVIYIYIYIYTYTVICMIIIIVISIVIFVCMCATISSIRFSLFRTARVTCAVL